MPAIVAQATLSPVKEPGPTPTAKAPISCQSSPALSINPVNIGKSSRECALGVLMVAVALLPSGNSKQADAPADVSKAKTG